MTAWNSVLVMVKDDPRLFAKIIAHEGTHAEVEFFLSVAEREIRRLPLADLAHAVLPKQTRVFVKLTAGIWRVGRVVDRFKDSKGLFDYTVRFPNDETAELSELDCYVRCLDRHADPSKILSAHCIETEFFAEHRRRALRRLRGLTSAANGLTGVISAAVELLPHQVATVRRVVNDRKQRYLLADEVGLGKTIEAGLIIRQLQLDEPSRNFVVAVPGLLVGQWTSELALKCLVSLDKVSIIAHEALADLPAAEPIDMLVIDEAHRLVAAEMAAATSEAARALGALAGRSPRLLLLSATPALGDERKLLALLNLLDPENYSLSDLVGFTRRVAERQEIGRLLLAMRPDAPAFVIRKQAATAKTMFPADSVVAEEVDRILGLTDATECAGAVAGLRDHIASTYRIHQRLIRSRRVDVEKWTMRARGPDWPAFRHVRYFHLNEDTSATLADFLDRWRAEATLALEDRPDLLTEVTGRWDALLEAAWQGPDVIAEFAVTAMPIFDGEQDILDLFSGVGGEPTDRAESLAKIAGDWAKALGDDLSGRPRKIVCFVSQLALANRVAEAIAMQQGSARVLALTGEPSASDETVKNFANSPMARILVCDRASEEGLNLQFIHGILHTDMPTDATRVEQRIGRLDRFGRKIDAIEHRIVLPDDNESAPWAVWISLLANGFRIFHRSISDVQFRAEKLSTSNSRRMIVHGAHDLDVLIEDTVAAIADERQKLDEQYILEGVAKLVESGHELVNEIETSEDDEEAIEQDVNAWIKHVIGLGISQVGPTANHSLAYSWTEATLTPEIPWRQVLQPSLKNRWTWRRVRASQVNGQPAFLMRPGSTLCEALERVALWDDRGIAYATWRIERSWPNPWRGFRLVWIVEPGLSVDGAVHERRKGAETARRAAGFLPVTTIEHIVDIFGKPETDSKVLDVLSRGYKVQSKGLAQSNLNLGSRPEMLDLALEGTSFEDVVTTVVEASRRRVFKQVDVAAKLDAARQACERDVARARRVIDIRAQLAASGSVRVEPPSQGDRESLDLLMRAVTGPTLRLDEIGFYLIAAPGKV